MAVTKQTYTATATWTASQLANLFRDAFIDAGLMTDWHDSFLSGAVENRVLEIQYDNTKTYGKTYYWFQFTTTGVFIHVAAGWNTVGHVPTGTQYLDYFATTTNSTANHKQIATLSTATAVSVARYSSAVTSGFSWFLVTNGATIANIHIPRAGVPRPAWIDLNKTLFHFYGYCHNSNVGNLSMPNICFRDYGPCLRRSFHAGAALHGNTTAGHYADGPMSFTYDSQQAPGLTYICFGVASSNSIAKVNWRHYSPNSIVLPTYLAAANPAFADNNFPVFSDILYSPYISEALPADFALSWHYANNVMAAFDRLIVAAASEEWEIVTVFNTNTVVSHGSALFMARAI
jgi:hypothetical protein